MGPKKGTGRRPIGRDDEGAETVEFAIVVVLLIALLYGIVSVGLSLAAKVTVTQAAADGARAGIVVTGASTQTTTAQNQAGSGVSWMGRGACGAAGSNATITCVATEANCSANPLQTCLTVTVTYNYAKSPLFPPVPGLSITSPTTITSSSTLQVSTPSS